MEEKQALQLHLEETVDRLWLKLQHIAKEHKETTEEKRRIYQELMQKDKKGLAEVVENNKKILKLTVGCLCHKLHEIFGSTLASAS